MMIRQRLGATLLAGAIATVSLLGVSGCTLYQRANPYHKDMGLKACATVAPHGSHNSPYDYNCKTRRA